MVNLGSLADLELRFASSVGRLFVFGLGLAGFVYRPAESVRAIWAHSM
jgi:hypothetical protein